MYDRQHQESDEKNEEETLKRASLEERIEQRVATAMERNDLGRQVERLVGDFAKIEDINPEGMPRQERRARERQRSKWEARHLRLLKRDDELVGQALERRERINEIVDASQPSGLDELLWYVIEKLKLSEALKALCPPQRAIDEESGREIKLRRMYSPLVLNLLGLMSRYMGLSDGPGIQTVLLCDPRWMALLGFNAQEVIDGATQRSKGLIGKTRDGKGGRFEDAGELGPARARIEGSRGVLSWQTLADHESELSAEDLVKLFNAVVRALAKEGMFPKEIRASLDTTGEEVVPSFENAGVVRKKVKVGTKARKPRQVEVRVRGFKVWYLMEVETGLPLGFAFARIEKPDNEHAKAVILQAKENLKGYSRMISVALDRGFLDGDLLWWLDKEQHILWACPSKEKMEVTTEARQRVHEVIEAAKAFDETDVKTAERLAQKRKKQEGVTFFERMVGPNRDSLLLAQVDGLYCTDFYGPGGTSSSRLNSKKFEPTPLCATVVLRWSDRSSKDRQDQQEHDLEGNGPVVLLSPVVESALARFLRYDERSLIENRVNRDAKQHFGLGATLCRTPAALLSATVFSTIALMLYRGLEIHREKAIEEFDKRAEALGVLRYRRQMMLLNRGKIIIVVGENYGVFTFGEFARIAGFEVGDVLLE